jgi:hypothetical protein
MKMLNVKSIKTNVVISWLYMGYPATVITLLKNWKKTEQNDVVDAVRANGHKTVVINGSITKNPEVKPLIVWLCSIWFTVILSSDASDDIEPLRNVRGCNFLLRVTPPNENQNNINGRMLQYLKPSDELIFILDDETIYADAITFLTTRVITKPTITFVVEEGSKMKDQVIADSKSFRFACRILPTKLD